jgi:hypothetical protein
MISHYRRYLVMRQQRQILSTEETTGMLILKGTMRRLKMLAARGDAFPLIVNLVV